MDDLDEATKAVSLGGSIGKKWSTPDVLGVYRPTASQRLKFAPEFVAAEIKADAAGSVTAFGQAVAYRLFAAKSYIVMPYTLAKEEFARLEALCMLFGVGLVQFTLDKANPAYTIKVRAQRSDPDIFYVNEFADRLPPTLLDALFA